MVGSWLQSVLGWLFSGRKRSAAEFGPFASVLESPGAPAPLLLLSMRGSETGGLIDRIAQASTRPHAAASVDAMFESPDWRPHVIAAVALILDGGERLDPTPLWAAIDSGSWVTPQLVATAYLIDPAFAERLRARLESRCAVQVPAGLSAAERHRATGPATSEERSAKLLAALLQIGMLVPSLARRVASAAHDPQLATLRAADRTIPATSPRIGSRMSKASSGSGAAHSRRRPDVETARSAAAAPLEGLLPCPHRPPCSACPRFGEPGIAPAAEAALDELARAHGLENVSIVSGRPAAFRLRARLAIRGRRGSPKLGLFEFGTHRVVHVPSCRVQHPLINHVANTVRRALVEAGVTCYSERAHSGVARYLQVVVERSSQSAQVVMVANAATSEPLTACFALIREWLGAALHSLWFNSNCSHTNAILGHEFGRVHGPESVVESFGGARVHYPPGAFGQSNLDLAEKLIGHVRELVPQDASVVEFHGGVGAIGLSIVDRVRELRVNELNPHSLRGLALGLDELAPAQRAKISVLPGAAEAVLEAADGAEVVIVDPPRRGLDAELTRRLRDEPPQRLLYVSCGLDSLLEDVALLTGGRLKLAGLTAFDLMPYTDHVETVARLDRR